MKKTIFVFLAFVFSLTSYSQEVSVTTGFDLFYFPSFSPKFVNYSRTYSLAYHYNLNEKWLLGAKYRYVSIKGNQPYIEGENIQIHNIDYSENHVFGYKEFRKGFFSKGREAKRWSTQSSFIGLQSKYKIIDHNKYFLSIFLGLNLELYKFNGLQVVIHNADLIYPNGDITIVDTYGYLVRSRYYHSANTGLELGCHITDNTFIAIASDFNYIFLEYSVEEGLRWEQAGHFLLDFTVGYKF